MSTATNRVPESIEEEVLAAAAVIVERHAIPAADAIAGGVLSFPGAPAVSFWQRAVEISVAVIALLLFLPVMLIEAIIIRLDTPGPALFRQQRVGLNRKPFTFVKFRTLFNDARERFPELYRYQYTAEQLPELYFKVFPDPRVTPQGRWLRKTSLDELPNFWNLLTGEMALVGPRPEIPEMLPYYKGRMLHKFRVRPGITGLAQISGRGRLTFYETVEYDVQYALNRTFWLDVKIVLKTLWLICVRDGAF